MIKIPRCMSSQHPDNVSSPFFAENNVIGGDDEIQEAYYAFSHLGCEEQMWDCEGKEVDNFVVKKLLSKYEQFFQENKLGKDVFITLRVPNPEIEKAEAKILLETLEGIPRSFDAAQPFYNGDFAPIFEVILPMTTSQNELNRIYYYYRDFVVGKQNEELANERIKIADWIGKFKPDEINVIPLIEDMEHLLDSHNIVRNYLEGKRAEYQRVFLARSDPALNYGALTAVLTNKIALQNLHQLQEKISIDILPIIGVGSAPFRGNLTPENPENCLEGYPSAQTFTIQSAFKYDYSEKKITSAISKIQSGKRKAPTNIDEEKCGEIIGKSSKEYGKIIALLAPIINKLAKYIPPRRKRKLHIGLFGYSRHLDGISLPRAITFCSALYSIGLPPEIIGLSSLTEKDIDYICEIYGNFEGDLKDSMQYFNEDVLKILPNGVGKKIRANIVDYELNALHKKETGYIINCLKKEEMDMLPEHIVKAARIRNFLG